MGFMSSSVPVKGLPLALQRLVQDPVGISAIASLALHLPLVLFLPRLFSTTPGLEEPELKSSVDVVELSPAEQGRIPDFQTPEIILPSLAQTPSSLSITPLPKPSTTLSPSLPPLTPPSSSMWGLGSSTFQFPAQPKLPSIMLPPASSYTIIPPPVQQRPAPQPPAPTASPTVAASPTASPTPTATPTATATPAPTASPTPGDIAAVEPVQPTRTEAQVNQELLARTQERRDSFTYNAEGTGEAARQSAFNEWLENPAQPWLEKEQAAVVAMIVDNKVNIDGAYPPAAAYHNLAGVVELAVLVDKDGKPDPEVGVTVLNSSGYKIFDQQAIAEAMNYKFDATGEKTAYYVTVKFAPRPVS
jgi:TonB family protein